MTRSGDNEDDGFCLLAATLLNALPSSTSVPDTLLMQLHAVFGPTLLSALQLIDRREVNLPGGRSLYQVTSSTGQPYTLYNSLPPLVSRPTEPADNFVARSPSPTPAPLDPFGEISEPSSAAPAHPPADERETDTSRLDLHRQEERQYQLKQAYRIRSLAMGIEKMYCPCAGFLFNSLGGERNFLCKHLLSVLIAHHTGKMISTEVYLPGVVELLGLARQVGNIAPSVAAAG